MGEKVKSQSTFVGLKYPRGRNDVWKTGTKWLDEKRRHDGAEGLWRVGDKLYDLAEWARNHPGGEEWITLTKGTDITEAFEVHHINLTPERLLPKFYVRDAVVPRASPLTFKPEGFYRKFKARAREALKDVNFHKPSITSNLIIDSLCASTLALCWIAAATQSWIAIAASGIFLTWTATTAHNYFHQRDSFRMYYFDLILMSSKEWRIVHVLSHHFFTNTICDMQSTVFEPFLLWMTWPDKPFVLRFGSWLYSPIIYMAVAFEEGLKRIYSVIWEWNGPEMRDVVPFVIPCLMCLAASPVSALVTWLKIMAIASFYFFLIGLNTNHHHPDIYHDGDVCREDQDWGLLQLDTIRDAMEFDEWIFLILTHFGSHTLHHLLPTVDHAYLHLCKPALIETCKEFDVDTELWTQWELFKGQWAQLANIKRKQTPNIRGKFSSSLF